MNLIKKIKLQHLFVIILLAWVTAMIAEYIYQDTIGILIMSCFYLGALSLGKAAQLRLK